MIRPRLTDAIRRRVSPARSRRRPAARAAVARPCESLDARVMLAGNVVATANANTVRLTGDDADNNVDVTVDDTGMITVTGNDGTTINGQPAITVPVGTLKNVRVDMNGGDDVLTVDGNGAGLTGNAHVKLGDGDDQLFVEDLNFGRWVTIRGGDGNDVIAADGVTAGRDIRVDAGRGDDAVQLLNGVFGDDVILKGRSGNDGFQVEGHLIADDLRIDGGGSSDAVYVANVAVGDDLKFDGRHGDDLVLIRNVGVGDDLRLDGDGGHDVFAVTGIAVADDLRIDTDKGRDVVIMGGGNTFDPDAILGGGLGEEEDDDDDDIVLTAEVLDEDEDGPLAGYLGDPDNFAGLAADVAAFNALPDDFQGNLIGDDVKVTLNSYADHFVACGYNTVGDDMRVRGGPDSDYALIDRDKLTVGDKLKIKSFKKNRGVDVEGRVVGVLDRAIEAVRDEAGDLADGLIPAGDGADLYAGLCEGFPDGGQIDAEDAQVVFVIDTSGSTGSAFGGTPVGDIDGDGDFDTILDAELAALLAFETALVDAGTSGTALSVVTFSSLALFADGDPSVPGIQSLVRPGLDTDMDGVSDLLTGAIGAIQGGGTNFQSGLASALSILTDAANAGQDNLNVIFLSDGQDGGPSFAADVQALNDLGANLFAFGIGQGSSLPALQLIDPNAIQVNSTDEFIAAIADLI